MIDMREQEGVNWAKCAARNDSGQPCLNPHINDCEKCEQNAAFVILLLRKKLKDAEMNNNLEGGCLAMIGDELAALSGEDKTHIPPMMYPEWIKSIITTVRKETIASLEKK